MPKLHQLTLAQQIALQATQAEIVRMQNRMQELFREAGLDLTKQYNFGLDGVVTEVENGA